MASGSSGRPDPGNEEGSPKPGRSMRLRSSSAYPELCDMTYRLHDDDGRRGVQKRLSMALIGRHEPPPTRPEWYDFAAFCDHNKLGRDGDRLAAHLEVTYEAVMFEVSDGRSWQAMLTGVDQLLRLERMHGKPFTPPTLELRPLPARPDPGQKPGTTEADSSPIDIQSWIAYSGGRTRVSHKQPSLMDNEAEDDEWAACCEFMLHPYDDRGRDAKKLLLGTVSAITPAEMLGAYRFLSRVAQGEGGMVVQTIGHPGTLRTQLITTCILRLVVLCKRHYLSNRRQHEAGGAGPGRGGAFGCGAGDPFGIQCVCRPGTMTSRLADLVGDTARPFVYLLRRQAMDRCQEAMKNFFLRRLRSPSRYPMLQAVPCKDANTLAELPPDGAATRYVLSGDASFIREGRGARLDRGGFIVLIDIAQAAAALAPPGAVQPAENTWLWRECRPLYTCMLDWRLPMLTGCGRDVAAAAIIAWVASMRFSTPGEAGMVSITTPGEVTAHGDRDWCRRPLVAIAPTLDEGRRRVLDACLVGAEALRRYGLVRPYEPDLAIRTRPADGIKARAGGPETMTVTVEYALLGLPGGRQPLLGQLCLPAPHFADRLARFAENFFAEAKGAGNTLTADLLAMIDTDDAQILNILELFRFTRTTFAAVEDLFARRRALGAISSPRMSLMNVFDASPSVQRLVKVIGGHRGSAGGVLVLVNDEALTINIAHYFNLEPRAGVTEAVALTPDWVSPGEGATTQLEAEVRMRATGDPGKTVVVVAGPGAMDSGCLSLGYVHCCVVFGAPFSPLTVRSMVQAVCGSGGPRDVRIVHIGLAGEPGQSLNGVLRVACMEGDMYGLGID